MDEITADPPCPESSNYDSLKSTEFSIPNEDKLDFELFNNTMAAHTISDSEESGGEPTDLKKVESLPSNKTRRKKQVTNDMEAVWEKKRRKELKAKERQERRELLEKYRRTKPNECIKYVSVLIEESLKESRFLQEAFDLLKSTEITSLMVKNQEPCSVTWQRKQVDGTVIVESHLLFIWSSVQLVQNIQINILSETFSRLKKTYPNSKMYLALYGLNDYFRKKKKDSQKSSQDSISRERIETALTEVEILHGVSHRRLNTSQELATFLQQTTKAIAQLPYKTEMERRDLEKSWYLRGDSRDCVRVDANYFGLNTLWTQHLAVLPRSSLDVARAIVAQYPTPCSLYEILKIDLQRNEVREIELQLKNIKIKKNAYERLSSDKEREELLMDIPVGRGESKKRVGPDLSRKISIMYWSGSGGTLLSSQ